MSASPVQIALTVVEVSALVSFAVSGVMAAMRKGMDVVGVFSVAAVAAFGGGTVRDVLLDKRPFFWVQHQEYLWLMFVLTFMAPSLARLASHRYAERAIEVPDALGLGLFCAAGTAQALAAGMPLLVAAMMGVVTGVVGGVLRDILCNEIPIVFRDHRPYALCGFAGCWTLIGLHAADAGQAAALAGGAAVATGTRLLAVARGWAVPSWPAKR